FVKAFVTDIGGRTAHSAIMARSLEIPAVVGTQSITQDVKDGQMVAVDGLTGDVIVEPSADDIARFQKEADAYAKQKAEWETLKTATSITADGKHYDVAANIGTPKDLDGVLANGAE
ncbi:PEP-utilizing enzyme, partial [Lacticaseibacillus saniviri]